MRRTHLAMESSDLLLLLVDARSGIDDVERSMLKQFQDQSVLVVSNKIDLLTAPVDDPEIDVQISAKTGEGIETLQQKIKEHIVQGDVLDSERSVLFANRRHLDALDTAEKALSEIVVQSGTVQDQKLEIIAENLRIAQQALANITGAYTTEELLGDIFSRFCVGK